MDEEIDRAEPIPCGREETLDILILRHITGMQEGLLLPDRDVPDRRRQLELPVVGELVPAGDAAIVVR